MRNFDNYENQNGELSVINEEEIKYITKYISRIFDTFLDSQLHSRCSKDILDNVKSKLLEYTCYIFCTFYDAYKKSSKEKCDIHELLSYLDHGFFSYAFKMGEYVIKIGLIDTNQPFKEVDSLSTLNNIFHDRVVITSNLSFMISIAPYAKRRFFSTEEEYEVYRNLRSDGFIWNDPKEENIGILGEDRTIFYDGVLHHSLKDGQKPGDKVIFDLDDISSVRGVSQEGLDIIYDEICFNSYNKNTYIFETRYRQEYTDKRE